MRILITGSRTYSDMRALEEAIEGAPRRSDGIVTIVHGDCPTGADRLAKEFCTSHPGFREEAHPADWGRRGKAAGPKRNQEMVDLGADICLAFPSEGSRGTWDCVRRARKAGIEVKVIG